MVIYITTPCELPQSKMLQFSLYYIKSSRGRRTYSGSRTDRSKKRTGRSIRSYSPNSIVPSRTIWRRPLWSANVSTIQSRCFCLYFFTTFPKFSKALLFSSSKIGNDDNKASNCVRTVSGFSVSIFFFALSKAKSGLKS